jgi:hypothetical protein
VAIGHVSCKRYRKQNDPGTNDCKKDTIHRTQRLHTEPVPLSQLLAGDNRSPPRSDAKSPASIFHEARLSGVAPYFGEVRSARSISQWSLSPVKYNAGLTDNSFHM